jgi:hypothetical protein
MLNIFQERIFAGVHEGGGGGGGKRGRQDFSVFVFIKKLYLESATFLHELFKVTSIVNVSRHECC